MNVFLKYGCYTFIVMISCLVAYIAPDWALTAGLIGGFSGMGILLAWEA